MTAHPQTDEYAPFYMGYVQLIPENSDIFKLLSNQADELHVLLDNVSDEQASVRPAPNEWSIKEVIGHICDGERIFAYRALRIGRGDTHPLAGFEQNEYVTTGNFNARSLNNLVEEFALQRRANLLCFKPFSETEMLRRGTASEKSISVRALLFIMVGHVMHHIESLKTDYHIGG